jgi:hypothetical protein
MSAKKKKRSPEKTREAEEQRRLSIEVKERVHALSSTRKMYWEQKG